MATSSETELLEQVSGAPYYSVQIIPPAAIGKTLPEIKKLVAESVVSIRGWDFPHADDRETFTADAYVFGLVDWDRHRELWRAYPSGQFVYIGGVWDAEPQLQAQLMNEIRRSIVAANDEEKRSVAGALSFIGIIYSVTEFYLFAARFGAALEAAGLMRIRIVLHGVEHWALAAGEPAVIWHSFYQSRTQQITSDAKVNTAELFGNPLEHARVAIRDIFTRFNWHDVGDTTIADWQDRIVKSRF